MLLSTSRLSAEGKPLLYSPCASRGDLLIARVGEPHGRTLEVLPLVPHPSVGLRQRNSRPFAPMAALLAPVLHLGEDLDAFEPASGACRGFSMCSPVESVAKCSTPRSSPTAASDGGNGV